MQIGTDDNFLCIESSPLEGGYPAFRIEAVATASGGRFTASHDELIMNTDEGTLRRFADFESLKSEQIEIPITEGGWLRLQRDSPGYIKVRYRIGGWKASAAMEGEVVIDGEYASRFCREFGAFLLGQR